MKPVEKFVQCAKNAVGGRYQWAAAGPDAWDCSGLVAYCYRDATGENISRDSHGQATLGQEVRGEIQPGDVLLFDTMQGQEVRLGNAISHVGIAVSARRMVNALNQDYGVVESDLNTDYWRPRYRGARRLFAEGALDPGEPAGKPGGDAGPAAASGDRGPTPPPARPTRDRDWQRKREKDRRRRGGRKGRR
ncbi:MAG: C40 family peptidase [Dehalococcoidia bacterium]